MTCKFHIVAHAFFILFFPVNLCNTENFEKQDKWMPAAFVEYLFA
jgi:hypothetical protein